MSDFFEENDPLLSALEGLGCYSVYPNGLIQVGDIYMAVGNYDKIKRQGLISKVVVPISGTNKFEIPELTKASQGTISSTTSDKVSRNIGLTFLASFLKFFGINANVDISAGSGSNEELKFQFDDANIYEVSDFDWGNALEDFKLNFGISLPKEGTFYLTSKVLKSSSITVSGSQNQDDEFAAKIELDMGINQGQVQGKLERKYSHDKGLTYNGKDGQELTFAIDLLEVIYDNNNGKITGLMPETPKFDPIEPIAPRKLKFNSNNPLVVENQEK
jgi:hypothetical protein